MLAKIKTVTFDGIEAKPITAEVQVAAGLPKFTIVGLPDKSISEARERIQSVFTAIGLSLPPKKITVNLAPADMMKEGSHFDLPIAMGILSALEIVDYNKIKDYVFIGELGLDGNLAKVSGVMPAAFYAVSEGLGIVCPKVQGSEALWTGCVDVLAPGNIINLMNHFNGEQPLAAPNREMDDGINHFLDFSDIKGQEFAKRGLEIAAAGGHNLIFTGPAGAGKSAMAERLPTILPPMTAAEALEVSMIHSIAGTLNAAGIETRRPFRAPHHTASQIALTGGGTKAKPGEVSLAHNGVLFLDELPEFSGQTLDALRQPIETGRINVSRANKHISYPANFQLIAAMNPCKCGHFGDKERECNQAPLCALKYQNRISGPMWDRIDIYIEVQQINPWELSSHTAKAESSAEIRERVIRARKFQEDRWAKIFPKQGVIWNKNVPTKDIEKNCNISPEALDILIKSAEKFKLSARGYHRILKVARTIADLEMELEITPEHISEAILFRKKEVKL
ncbi:MAG: YifB family Mg chelatase-like AAA ATPase [Alphaproteobacteria bacterium]|jgi:magnesium chelatase family protein|nr:YifB family Mg chelatase-like AAA ATPase [Alphaproteobacteria bacterium]